MSPQAHISDIDFADAYIFTDRRTVRAQAASENKPGRFNVFLKGRSYITVLYSFICVTKHDTGVSEFTKSN